VILGHCELLQQLDNPWPTASHINAITTASRRLAEIVDRIKRLDRYHTKSYLGASRILDLGGSSPVTDEEPAPT
jgi:hypothetical protein